MLKKEFLAGLRKKLAGLPRGEREERLAFYAEMIDDRMEEGLTEEEAVAAVSGQELDLPQKPEKRPRGWEVALLIAGSPLWLSLLVAAAAVVISLYAAVWSVVVSLWAVFASLIGTGFGGLIAGVAWCSVYPATGAVALAASLGCFGLSVFAFYGCRILTRTVVDLTARAFRKKEVDQ